MAALRCAISCSRFGGVFLGDSARDLRLDVVNVGAGFSELDFALATTVANVGDGDGGRDLELRVARFDISGVDCFTISSREDLRRCDVDFGVAGTCGDISGAVVFFCGVLFGDLFVEFCRVTGGGLSSDLRGERFGTVETVEAGGTATETEASLRFSNSNSLRFSTASLSLSESEPLPLLELSLLLLEELLLLSLSPELELDKFGAAIRRFTGVCVSSLERLRGVLPSGSFMSEVRLTGVVCCLLVADLLEGVAVVTAAAAVGVVTGSLSLRSFRELDSCVALAKAAPLFFNCSAAFLAACLCGT